MQLSISAGWSVHIAAAILLVGGLSAAAVEPFVPPATPLVACDPYFSIWSTGKRLTDVSTTHWTGRPHPLASLIRIDGAAFRLMGPEPAAVPPLEQASLQVWPTRSIYTFRGAGVEVVLTFTTPALPFDIDILSRPITFIAVEARATDGRNHAVEWYLDASAEVAVNQPEQTVEETIVEGDGFKAARIGSIAQNVLGHTGDDIRIDWGYFYLAAGRADGADLRLGAGPDLRAAFVSGQASKDKRPTPGPASGLAASVAFYLGAVGEQPVERCAVVAYDDLASIEFMQNPLQPYWRRNGLDAAGLLQEAVRDRAALESRCTAFDRELMADLERVGGVEYAQLAAVAYRQCFAAGKFVADAAGQPIQFCKENHSNGCIATSDVFYPMAPQFLLFGPSLAKSFLVPFMEYAASDRWRFPFAPHDLGTYPKANGQVYGGGERTEENQMPVEESGNLLILMAAVAQMEGSTEFADRYWSRLTQWAEYLLEKGFDPENQLCTDDFAGHLAHNVNLSAKAICGLGAYAKLCEMRGDAAEAARFRKAAKDFAAKWVEAAADGDHYRLTFDRPGTWSQKYNLVWDRILGLGLFPADVLRTEMAHYRKVQNTYGLPLDNRNVYTKLDWILWTATLTQDRADFEALVAPVHRFLRETPDRVPLTDWYQTDTGRRVGFTARPVVGGVFLQPLYDAALWRKWAARDTTRAAGYAPLPKPPKITTIVAAASEAPAEWRYTFDRPTDGWSRSAFDDSDWSRGPSGFGVADTPGAVVGTPWRTGDIWLRRSFDLPAEAIPAVSLLMHHDEDVEVYLNGVLACRLAGYTTAYQPVAISAEARAVLKPVGNVMAVHCHQTGGGQFIDVGLVTVERQPAK
ncbi:MAG: hypothetical protein RLZZ440_2860 [Planctomycetota bacterium]